MIQAKYVGLRLALAYQLLPNLLHNSLPINQSPIFIIVISPFPSFPPKYDTRVAYRLSSSTWKYTKHQLLQERDEIFKTNIGDRFSTSKDSMRKNIKKKIPLDSVYSRSQA